MLQLHLSDQQFYCLLRCSLYYIFNSNCHLSVEKSLQWHHNESDGVSNQQPHDCLLNRSFRRRSLKQQSSASLAFVRGIHGWPVNSPHKGPEHVSIWWRHHVMIKYKHDFMLPERHSAWLGSTHCGMVMPYGDIELGQHWLRAWFVAWWHQAITWTNVDWPSVSSTDYHLRAISQEIRQSDSVINF